MDKDCSHRCNSPLSSSGTSCSNLSVACRLERTCTCKLGDLQGLTHARRGVPGSMRTTGNL